MGSASVFRFPCSTSDVRCQGSTSVSSVSSIVWALQHVCSTWVSSSSAVPRVVPVRSPPWLPPPLTPPWGLVIVGLWTNIWLILLQAPPWLLPWTVFVLSYSSSSSSSRTPSLPPLKSLWHEDMPFWEGSFCQGNISLCFPCEPVSRCV